MKKEQLVLLQLNKDFGILGAISIDTDNFDVKLETKQVSRESIILYLARGGHIENLGLTSKTNPSLRGTHGELSRYEYVDNSKQNRDRMARDLKVLAYAFYVIGKDNEDTYSTIDITKVVMYNSSKKEAIVNEIKIEVNKHTQREIERIAKLGKVERGVSTTNFTLDEKGHVVGIEHTIPTYKSMDTFERVSKVDNFVEKLRAVTGMSDYMQMDDDGKAKVIGAILGETYKTDAELKDAIEDRIFNFSKNKPIELSMYEFNASASMDTRYENSYYELVRIYTYLHRKEIGLAEYIDKCREINNSPYMKWIPEDFRSGIKTFTIDESGTTVIGIVEAGKTLRCSDESYKIYKIVKSEDIVLPFGLYEVIQKDEVTIKYDAQTRKLSFYVDSNNHISSWEAGSYIKYILERTEIGKLVLFSYDTYVARGNGCLGISLRRDEKFIDTFKFTVHVDETGLLNIKLKWVSSEETDLSLCNNILSKERPYKVSVDIRSDLRKTLDFTRQLKEGKIRNAKLDDKQRAGVVNNFGTFKVYGRSATEIAEFDKVGHVIGPMGDIVAYVDYGGFNIQYSYENMDTEENRLRGLYSALVDFFADKKEIKIMVNLGNNIYKVMTFSKRREGTYFLSNISQRKTEMLRKVRDVSSIEGLPAMYSVAKLILDCSENNSKSAKYFGRNMIIEDITCEPAYSGINFGIACELAGTLVVKRLFKQGSKYEYDLCEYGSQGYLAVCDIANGTLAVPLGFYNNGIIEDSVVRLKLLKKLVAKLCQMGNINDIQKAGKIEIEATNFNELSQLTHTYI